MAIAFRSAAYQGNFSVGAGGSWTVYLPTGVQENDILLYAQFTQYEITETVPEGWTLIAETNFIGTGSRWAIYWKRAGAGETAFEVSTDTATWQESIIAAYSGCLSTGDIIDGTPTSVVSQGTDRATIPSLTTTVDGCEIVCGGPNWNWQTVQSVDAPPNNVRLDQNGIFVASGSQATAGPTGDVDYVISGSTSEIMAIMFAVKPAGTTPPASATLTVSDGAQAQVANSPTLTQTHALIVTEGQQGQVAGTPTLTQTHVLAVEKATQAQVADSVVLTQGHQLTVQTTGQAQTAGAPNLTQAHILSVQTGQQSQTTDSLVLSESGPSVVTLTIQGVAQAQTAANVILSQVHNLSVDGAGQSQSVDNVVLSVSYALTVQAATQSQTASNVVLAVLSGLLVASAGQSQSADNLTLTQIHNLSVSAAAQRQIADSVMVVLLSALIRVLATVRSVAVPTASTRVVSGPSASVTVVQGPTAEVKK